MMLFKSAHSRQLWEPSNDSAIMKMQFLATEQWSRSNDIVLHCLSLFNYCWRLLTDSQSYFLCFERLENFALWMGVDASTLYVCREYVRKVDNVKNRQQMSTIQNCEVMSVYFYIHIHC